LHKLSIIELDYWLPGMTMGASGARQPVDISVNENKLQVSKIAHIKRRKKERERKKTLLKRY